MANRDLIEDCRPFPIQGHRANSRDQDKQPCSIPWWLAEKAYEVYSNQFGTTQSLQRLADRGGFGRYELTQLLKGEW